MWRYVDDLRAASEILRTRSHDLCERGEVISEDSRRVIAECDQLLARSATLHEESTQHLVAARRALSSRARVDR